MSLKDRILFWFLFRKVRKQKKFLLWEAQMDKNFFETEMKKQLEYNEAKDRETMAAENRKPLDKQNTALITELENNIAVSKAVKASYRKTLELIDEVIRYLKMLGAWKEEN